VQAIHFWLGCGMLVAAMAWVSVAVLHAQDGGGAGGPATAHSAVTSGSASAPALPGFGSDECKAGQPYLVRKAAGAITIDDKPHPEQWANAQVIKDFKIPKSHKPARSQTAAMMLWDDKNLYVQAVAADIDLRAKYKSRTDPLWEEDVVELFLKPYADKSGYYELEVNPIGTVMALQIDSRSDKKSLKERSAWETGIQSAVQAVGTINDPSDNDQYYRVIMAIPWKNLAHIGNKPPTSGETWKFAFCRYDYSKAHPKAEESSNAPLTMDSFHRYEDYCTMKFE
jgi:hypothetical protein